MYMLPNKTIYEFKGTSHMKLATFRLIITDPYIKMEYVVISMNHIIMTGIITKHHNFICKNENIIIHDRIIFSVGVNDIENIKKLNDVFTKFYTFSLELPLMHKHYHDIL